ncbi:hypothetical protein Trco_004501 [Trichoderma cornu-damae]|uniref:Uncharacterized protein n=1 Tax=Trichoderma cornu-damae TaxID=654480 RepID=A0A9P8QSZ5_9HYPO|nr:hypothetical protein Trco_004501 [Trichoderma cornu-damae]
MRAIASASTSAAAASVPAHVLPSPGGGRWCWSAEIWALRPRKRSRLYVGSSTTQRETAAARAFVSVAASGCLLLTQHEWMDKTWQQKLYK